MASQRLLEYGFRFFATQKILNANQEYKQINIWGGVEKTLGLGVLEDISITLPRTSFKNLVVNYNYSNNIQAPIEIGQQIGTLEIVNNDEIVFSTEDQGVPYLFPWTISHSIKSPNFTKCSNSEFEIKV